MFRRFGILVGFILIQVDYSYQQLFVKVPENQQADVGGEAEFYLRMSRTGLEGTWYFKSTPLPNDGNTKYAPRNLGYDQYLNVYDLQTSDTGYYEFRVDGQSTGAYLTVAVTPVDGQWGEWGQWSVPGCPATCGDAARHTVTRQRLCDNPSPSNGGSYCSGSDTERDDRECGPACDLGPVHGDWSAWGPWDILACSATCGPDVSYTTTRRRYCNNPSPSNGGSYCAGTSFDQKYQQCGPENCTAVQHGNWSPWSEWDTSALCPVACGATGTHAVRRSRSCNNPPPLNGGSYCSGSDFESEIRQCLRNCGTSVTEWSPWGAVVCDVTCGGVVIGTRTRQRTCNTPASSGGCTVPLEEKEGGTCNLPTCPSAAVWLTWSAWSELHNCPAQCGDNVLWQMVRSRSCSSSVQSACTGETFQTKSEICAPACGTSEWGPWGPVVCGVTCGTSVTGVRTRQRTCNVPVSSGGCTVPLTSSEAGQCTHASCPINGDWGTWGDWTDLGLCPATCGPNVVKPVQRTRVCDRPPAQFGGSLCQGDQRQTMTQACASSCEPVNGGFGPWSDWMSTVTCPATCGENVVRLERRTRNCDNPAPQNGGQDCAGQRVMEEMRRCALQDCLEPVNGGFGPWSEWTGTVACPATCGENAVRPERRTRSCDNPAPQNGGQDCVGDTVMEEMRRCATQNCPSITVGLVNSTQPVGGHVVFEVTVSSGDLEGTWYKDGQEIFRSTNIQISVNGATHRLDIFNAAASDSGEYSFTVGDQTSYAYLVVEATIHGGWTPWTAWGSLDCPVPCRDTVQRFLTRTRKCTDPQPGPNGRDCVGPSQEQQLRDCPCGDDLVTGWTEWADRQCGATCGPSLHTLSERSRTCISSSGNCSSPLKQTRRVNCGLNQCPIHGKFSMWSHWSSPPCPVTCGKDAMKNVTRRRSCSSPRPQYGGSTCAGPAEETQLIKCSAPHCPVHGGFTTWEPWVNHSCTATCGEYATRTIQRVRTCSKPKPDHNGRFCTGHLQESVVKNCHLKECDGGIVDYLNMNNNGWFVALIGALVAIGVMLIIFIIACCVWHCRKDKASKDNRDLMHLYDMDKGAYYDNCIPDKGDQSVEPSQIE